VTQQQIHIVSGPSGVGKSTMVGLALSRSPNVHYATCLSEIDGHPHVLLETNCDSAMKAKEQYPHAHNTFILPPTMEALKSRLEMRQCEDEREIRRRLRQAAIEIHVHAESFNSWIVNGDDREVAASEIVLLINALRRGEKLSISYHNKAILTQVQNTFPKLACAQEYL
jgi:guanylate kinase